MNYEIQGSGALCVMYSFNQLHRDLKKNNKKSLLLASVHDSMELDVYPGELFFVMKQFKERCENTMPNDVDWIKCRMQVSMEIGTSWKSALELEIQELTDNKLDAVTEGIRYDVQGLVNQLKKAYNVECEILEESENKHMSNTNVYDDDIIQKVRIVVTGK